MPKGFFLATRVNPRLSNKAFVLDPRNDVIIEACAGSGKTWLLTSRIIRLLLSGTKSSEILAITFTRKAAQEMRSRLTDWLRTLTISDDEQVREFLIERGVSLDDVDACIPRARKLYREYLSTPSGVNVNTFHGWFLQILQLAPWAAQSGRGRELSDSDGLILRDALELFFKNISFNRDVSDALDYLYGIYELQNTSEILERFVASRLDWWASLESSEIRETVLAWRSNQNKDPLDDFLCDQTFLSNFVEFKILIKKNKLPSEMEALEVLESIEAFDNPEGWFVCLQKLSKKRGLLQAMISRMGVADAESYVRVSADLKALVDQLKAVRVEWFAAQLDRAVKIVGDCLLKTFQSVKSSSNIIDFADLEWNVRSLLLDDDQADFVLHRLDSRYTHLLVDEFQDTNPIQWTILKSWIDASNQAGTAIKLFFVGDPKQSIYRFRRAEPRLFGVAEKLIVSDLGGRKVIQNQSYRNAPGITELVNTCFETRINNFVPQQSVYTELSSELAVLPLVEAVGPVDACDVSRWRNPLLSSRLEQMDDRYLQEGLMIGEKIHLLILSKAIDDEGGCRSIRFSDIMILLRRRTHLKSYEDALRTSGIPFFSQRNGSLLESLEIQSVISLLQFLLTPHVDHYLIHVLKSPIFSFDDAALKTFIKRGDQSIWSILVDGQGCEQSNSLAEFDSAVRCLSSWIKNIDTVPAHDLLDMIYGESDLINRYAGHALSHLAERVRSNLIAFLEYSLDFSAGRYPSLERFLEKIRLVRAEEGVGPGEGLQSASLNAVRIMTIHGAKGLEAPIVFLADADAAVGVDNWDILVDWTPGEKETNHFSVYSSKIQRGEARSELFARHEALNRVEDTNLLYVAVTRARQAFFVSGVAQPRENPNSWYSLLRDAIRQCSQNKGLDVVAEDIKLREKINSDSSSKDIIESDAVAEQFSLGTRKERCTNSDIEFGILVHKILETITADVDLISKEATQQLCGASSPNFDAAWDVSLRIVQAPQLKRFFMPGNYLKAMNEVAYVNNDGNIKRIDRLVEFDDELWILDYKISSDQSVHPNHDIQSQYKKQLTQYRDDLLQIKKMKPIRIGVVLSSGELVEF
ncbi:MAG: UvrD-helicase domain-containing protein [Proteobacteria bacterium]|nr:UvrD-helicase domain-containing protein [Pseudomonadota bacterium]MDA1331162.1 UvrD-helicase domain-containing protein [Pseudomonadota bacterium]